METKSEDQTDKPSGSVLESSDTLLELKRLFPHLVTTLKGSVIFAKQFTILALSLITYSRGIFPAYAFSEKKYKESAVKVLSGGRLCCDAYLFTKWLKSALTALEKGYIKELIFEVMSLENVTLEGYSILYQYKGDFVICTVNAADKRISDFDETSFQRSVSCLISSVLSFMKKLEPLPEAYRLQLRILYYDEMTPENYIPDYFRDSDLDSYEKGRMLAQPLGSVDTPYHGIAMKIASCSGFDDEKKNIDGKSSKQHVEKKRKLPVEHQVGEIEENDTRTVVSGPPQKKITWGDLKNPATLNPQQSKILKSPQTAPPSETSVVETKPHSSSVTKMKKTLLSEGASQTSIEMNCICSLNTDKTGIFQCSKCNDWHHLICYKRKPISIVRSSRVACVKCAAENSDLECLDVSLLSNNKPMGLIEKMAIFRQMVFKLRWFALISKTTLVEDCRLSENTAKLVIDKFMKKKLISPCTRSGDYKVHSRELILFISNYFR